MNIEWRKSSRSDDGTGGECVEVAAFPVGAIAVRDSKNPEGPRLHLTRLEWRRLVTKVKSGDFDV